MTDKAKSLRLQGEKYILSEIERVGVKNIDGGAIVKTLMGMGVSRATAWNWLKDAREAAKQPVLADPLTAIAQGAVNASPHPRVRRHSAVNAKEIRDGTNLSQFQFAKRFGFSMGAVRQWERGDRLPDPAARMVLLLIQHDADLAAALASKMDAMEAAHSGSEARK